MRKSSAPVAIAAAVVALTGCDGKLGAPHTKADMEEEIAALRKEVTSLALTASDAHMMREELRDINQALQRIEYQTAAERFVTLRPNSDGYAVIRTALGQVTVDIESISANANGTSVLLKFGNPLNCDLRDAEMTIRYGATDAAGQPVEEMAKTKQIKVGKTLRGGRFTNVRIGLDDIKPADLGYISIGNLHHSGIALMQ
jgi:hypothetical protein